MFNTDYDWIANNPGYTFDYNVQCEFTGNRTYTKLNGLKALGGLGKIHHGNPSVYYAGPIFVSTNPEAIVYYTSYSSYNHFPEITYAFQYLGVIWYVGQDGYFWENQPLVDDLGNLLPISNTVYSRSREDLITLAKELIDLADVEIVEPSPMVYIPATYQQIEYLQSTSGQVAIDTGIKGEFVCELDMSFTSNGYRQLMGVNLYSNNYFGITASDNLEIGGFSLQALGTTRSNIVYLHNSENEMLQVDEETNSRGRDGSFGTNDSMKILTAISSVDSYLCIGKIYRCKIYTADGKLARDMYPVYRVSDNEPGMFDTVTETFLSKIGSSNFIVGPDVVPPVTIRSLLLYNNTLWETYRIFSYTGNAQEFTLQPGEYLIECNGAKGGNWSWSSIINRGGTTYGILNLETATTMYAMVGGDGGDASANGQPPGAGGFNGGGAGGISPSYANGPGGGGGTDIRLTLTDSTEQVTVTVPAEYDELEYIDSDGSQYIDIQYNPKSNTKVELFCEVHDNQTSWAVLFGSRNGNYYEKFGVNCNESGSYIAKYAYNSTDVNGSALPENVPLKIVADGPVCYFYDGNDQLLQTLDSQQSAFDSDYPLYIFAMNHASSQVNDKSAFRFKMMKIYESDALCHCYVPIADTGTTDNIGVYDIMDQQAFYKGGGNAFTPGSVKSIKTAITYTTTIPKSFLSRFIVAGGGGGGSFSPDQDKSYGALTAFGGGVNGGYPFSGSGDQNNGLYASQTGGYQFGVGMTGKTRKSSTQYWSGEGSGGGGGGWYGGYSSADDGSAAQHTSCNGGGGSGFALTSSTKNITPPRYFSGYTDRIDEFCLSNTTLLAGCAENAGITIYKRAPVINANDRIMCPCVGRVEQMSLPKGKYRLKAIGGAGGMRNDTIFNYIGWGGYAEGVLDNQENCTLYIRVGGSAALAAQNKNLAYMQNTFPTMSFNGGGTAYEYGDIYKTCCAAGGASDIRVNTDSLLARLIVAGGGGGVGAYDSNRGGYGGGTEGTSGQGDRYMTNGGAGGTQTGSPTMDDSNYQGGFGYGASARHAYIGAGGGGWYGGNTDNNSANIGGGGGSGYVLTENSYKPSGYLLGEEYYLSATYMSNSYTAKYPEYSAIIIEVLEKGTAFGILASDSSGYKEYDSTTERWKPFTIAGETLSPADFEEHGVGTFPTDAGLNTEYSILIYDPANNYNTAIFNVVPPTQAINIKHDMSAVLRSIGYDYDYDDGSTNVLISHDVKRRADGSQYLNIDISVSFTDIPETYPKFYDIIGYTLGSIIPNPTDPVKREKHLQHIDLLPIRAVKQVPSREKNYIGDTLYNGNTIESVQSSAGFVKDRTLYTVTECNNSVFRFAKLDLVMNQSTVIKDISKASFNNICIGDLIVIDDIMYISQSLNDTDNRIYKVSLNRSDTTVQTIRFSNGNNTTAKGKMVQTSPHQFIILTTNGFVMYDTLTSTCTETYKSGSQLGTCSDFAVGEDHILILGSGGNDSYVYDIENNTWAVIDLGWGTGSVCCYGDGKFYVTEPNYLYIVDEETLTLDNRVATPYTTIIPKTIDYGMNFLYATAISTSSVYIYDINRGEFSIAGTSFYPSSPGVATGNYRPCTFNTYFFMANVKLFVCNYAARAKYNLGLKGDQFIIPTNLGDLENNEYTYNPRYVSFDDSSMSIVPSTITKPLTIIDVDNMIKRVSISKNDYGRLSSVVFTKVEESGGGD